MPLLLEFSSKPTSLAEVLGRIQQALTDRPLNEVPDDKTLELVDVHLGRRALATAGEVRRDGEDVLLLWLDLPEDRVNPGH